MVDLSCDAATTGAMPADDSFYEGRLEFPNDCDWVRVPLEGGKQYAFSYVVDGDDPSQVSTLRMRAPDGAPLEELSQIYTWQMLGWFVTAPVTGTYLLEVRGTAAADYKLSVGFDCADSKPTNCSVRPGLARTGKMQNYYDNDTIRVALEAGRTYRFDVTSADTQGVERPYWVRLTGQRRVSVYGDAATPPQGSTLDERIDGFTAPYTGAYFLRVMRYDGFAAPVTYRVRYDAG